MIVGEPGIGKSRLVEEFRAQLGRRHTHGSNRGGGTRAVDQHQARSDASSWPCAIPGRVLIRCISIGSSTPSTPQSPVEQAWDCRFAAPSSMLIAASYGRKRTNPAAPYFSSRCRRPKRTHEFSREEILSLLGGRDRLEKAVGSWGEDAELLSARVAKSLPQSRDCKIKEGAQLQRHRAPAGVDNADRHR